MILGCAYCDHRFQVPFIGNTKSKRFCSYDTSLAKSIGDWLSDGELAVFDSIKEAEELGYQPYKSGPQRSFMDAVDIKNAIAQMSRQILQDCDDPDRLIVLGVRTVGVSLALRIAEEIEAARHYKPELGEIELYGSGDEIRRIVAGEGNVEPLNLKNREVILVDDVIYTGRTVKTALSIIFRSGRPRAVRLAVLIDRGHREVPVKPNYVGKNIPSSDQERVRVKLRGVDDEDKDQVVIYTLNGATDNSKTTTRPTVAKAIQ